jgi:hypothetical protein
MATCQPREVDPGQYMAMHMDLLREGLKPSQV